MVGAVGVEPTSRSCRNRGLPLTYAPVVGGQAPSSGDLHAALPAPQAGGTLSSLVPGGVTDGTRTRLAPGHGRSARLFALGHHGVRPGGVAPPSGGYRPPVLLLNYERVERLTPLRPSGSGGRDSERREARASTHDPSWRELSQERQTGLAPAWTTLARWCPATWATAAGKDWLGQMDSNHHSELQRLAAYRLADTPMACPP